VIGALFDAALLAMVLFKMKGSGARDLEMDTGKNGGGDVA
jgi:hypothetical protein